MSKFTDTRTFHFASGAIKFETDSAYLLDAVDLHFQHCLGAGESLVARYQARAEGEAFSILRDGEVFRENLTHEQVLFQLMQDGLTQLNGAPREHLVFHTAALAHHERGLMLCGKSGSGKSTLAAWLTAGGFEYLTDEVAAVPLAGGEMRGFCRSLVLKRGSSLVWERWLEGASDGFLRMADGSVWITPTLLNPVAVREAVVPHVVLFPTYVAGADLQVEKLSTANTMFRLMQVCVNARNFDDHGMGAVKTLAQTVSAYHLVYSDIQQAEEWIRKTLAA